MKQQGLGDLISGYFVVPQNPLCLGQGSLGQAARQQNYIMNEFNYHTSHSTKKRCAYCRSIRNGDTNCKNCGASETA